jgi:hypothetical protein
MMKWVDICDVLQADLSAELLQPCTTISTLKAGTTLLQEKKPKKRVSLYFRILSGTQQQILCYRALEPLTCCIGASTMLS